MSQRQEDNIVEFRRRPEQEGEFERKPRATKRAKPKTYSEAFAAVKIENITNGGRIRGYLPGRHVICKIDCIEPGGYGVTVYPDLLPGFLQSNFLHRIGDEVLAEFHGVDSTRVQLSDLWASFEV
jgi:hypothetical protein